ncbi:MAG: hypothetical protein IT247_08080, partial [Bacteroidia bacterium]|nr:hypothetical protein [Bacteroidia bacterium]
MLILSGIDKETRIEEINFQIRNLRENYTNDLVVKLISRFPEVAQKIATYSSKQLNKSITEKGLRYDLTVPFARYVVMNRNTITL